MAWQSVAAFWAVSLVFVLTPGADWAYAIAAGVRDRTVVPAIGGMLGGHVLATVVVATGIAAVIAGTPEVMTAVTVTGALYLAWLGIATLRHPPTPQIAETSGDISWIRRAGKGFGVSALNPKVFLLIVALLPQFTTAGSGWPIGWQITALGAVHLIGCAAVYAAVGLSARRVLRARPSAARMVARVSGVAMIGIGAVLVLENVL
ncbi:LysE family translocator [Gordonia desulfuricans]|uniref:LysE family translocator n=1 Tax=Gordonia desulfuricans TaxID=89051 RepID=A0A7K3LPP1_9ACTN|nr:MULTISPECIES: LysE family translocator [Gordonia]KOY49791.1 lysine transporter LysE [Gordonia sp. NB41Y]NDK90031.1 LysE family translocator [Gordonia desulfuricans]WLP90811.1 LysE family translocator [Gordonia sp. NB41Y]